MHFTYKSFDETILDKKGNDTQLQLEISYKTRTDLQTKVRQHVAKLWSACSIEPIWSIQIASEINTSNEKWVIL